ncbi:MAG: substrate-binding domain-containing protein [Candidatus Krumholzibacteriia bacterium]
MAARRRTWFRLRLVAYVVIVAVLFLVRGGVDRADLRRLLDTADGPEELAVAGRDLAPRLVDHLVAEYRDDYPDTPVRVTGGGTNHALEALSRDETGVAFLYRPPTPEEQSLFRAAHGDSAVVVPVAVGAAVLLAHPDVAPPALTPDELRSALAGAASPVERIYLADPNQGLWDAVRARLDLPREPLAGSPVVFLRDETVVASAVAQDAGAWGLVSSLGPARPDSAGGYPGAVVVPLRATPGADPAPPDDAHVARGDYPLYHRLYAATRGNGGIEAGKFVTYLASPRGLRQVARAGVVPARLVAREIHLTRRPVEP